MCAPDHPIKARMGEAMIPTCEIPRVVLSLFTRFVQSSHELGLEAVMLAITSTLMMQGIALRQRLDDEDQLDKQAEAAFETQLRGMALGSIGALAALRGITIAQAARALADAAEATEEEVGRDPIAALDEAADFTVDDVPDLIQVVYTSVRNPEEQIAIIQAEIDAGRGSDLAETHIKALQGMVGTVINGDNDDLSNLRSYRQAVLGDVGDKPLTEDDAKALQKELDALPTTDDPQDKKE